MINFDYPTSSEDYVHRIGRTARRSTSKGSVNVGTAYTFFTPGNASKSADLISVLKEAKQIINPKLQEMADTCKQDSKNGKGEFFFKRFY